MNVFISYGGAADQVTALRLQALAAVNRLTVYVPPAYTRDLHTVRLEPNIAEKMKSSKVVLGVVGAGLSDACRQELNAGLKQRKHMIVMADPQFGPLLQPIFGTNLVFIDQSQPHLSERGIVDYLKTIDAEESAKNALLVLGTLALGLLLFSSAGKR